MNSKMTTNSQLSTTERKKTRTNSKQTTRTGNRISEMEITWTVISGEEEGGEWGKRYRE